ncbi:MAG: UDP-N-acetylmuramate--alanine ligase [Alphaproteobacteria bacterium RIFCSPHIGHO2_12_FULL_63_12]|nr:MAG: UDP-N-acetylmuramate--alanine ligase [Alphaproteobacteria bacterium RIFCSPHIGHO2_12_FULL_63_12]
MGEKRQYFLCGVGGSGMLPLAMILRARGHAVSGSDRALDQGRTAPKFEFLKARGVGLFPQDGSGLVSRDQILVASAAIEETVPDIQAAIRLGARRLGRAELLAELFNAAATPIGVAGTSGKSTTTAMIAWCLHEAGRRPTVMNGAVMKNFVSDDAPFASALVGDGDAFVSELDESDGTIALYQPKIAVLNNVSLDHKSMEELRALFGDFLAKADTAILNLDDDETMRLAHRARSILTYSIDPGAADFNALNIAPQPFGVSFMAVDRRGGEQIAVSLKIPGRHNVSNALAAIAAATAAGVPFVDAARALSSFAGVKRRFEFVGESNGVTVIDDFGHNPDKIAATLKTLHDFPGRLLVLFQPHGFGPLKKMKAEFIGCFATHLAPGDVLLMPEPVYFGGTVDRSVGSRDIAIGVTLRHRRAEALATREACGARLVDLAKPGDRIVVMGARDDTLSTFAAELLTRL